MKIGIVCYPTFGGSGVVATELGMALAQKGHQVHFVTSHQPVKLNFLNHNLHFHEVFVEKDAVVQDVPVTFCDFFSHRQPIADARPAV